jgi:hypothetical protein
MIDELQLLVELGEREDPLDPLWRSDQHQAPPRASGSGLRTEDQAQPARVDERDLSKVEQDDPRPFAFCIPQTDLQLTDVGKVQFAFELNGGEGLRGGFLGFPRAHAAAVRPPSSAIAASRAAAAFSAPG